MDSVFWRGNWEEVPEDEYLAAHAELIKKDSWIIEGFIDQSMKVRAEEADLVIYLDFSGIRCLGRVLMRFFMHRKMSRPELHEDALEEFIPRFWWTVLTRGERLGIEAAVVNVKSERLVRLRTPRQLQNFLEEGLNKLLS